MEPIWGLLRHLQECPLPYDLSRLIRNREKRAKGLGGKIQSGLPNS